MKSANIPSRPCEAWLPSHSSLSGLRPPQPRLSQSDLAPAATPACRTLPSALPLAPAQPQIPAYIIITSSERPSWIPHLHWVLLFCLYPIHFLCFCKCVCLVHICSQIKSSEGQGLLYPQCSREGIPEMLVS